MKFEKSNLHLLFTAPAPLTLGASGDVSAADVFKKTEAPLTSSAEEGPRLVGALKGATKAFWSKLGAEIPRTNAAQRKRILSFVSWYCGKNGWQFEGNPKQPYLSGGVRVEGRLHAIVTSGPHSVAIEICSSITAPTLQKLRNAHISGKAPLLLWVGPPATVSGLLSRVAQSTGIYSTLWLEVASLTDAVQGSK